MRIFLAKISALALVAATSVVSSEKPAMPVLHGPVALAEALDAASSDKESSRDAFPPEEMEEEEQGSRRNRRNRNNDDLFDDRYDDNDDYDERPQKKSAAQKRQDQRDERRSRNNPNRSQREEQNERDRKSRQAANRSSRCTDPSEPGCGNDNYPRNREAKRRYRCDSRGESCDYDRVSPRDEPNRRRANDDMDCVERCNEDYPDDDGPYANDDFTRNRRDRNSSSNNSRARSCANRNCNGKKWKNGAATYGEWLLSQVTQE